jgi:hypothetical protein
MNSNIVYNNINTDLVYNKYYPPIKEIYDYLTYFCKDYNYKNILEIGPGKIQFPIANKFIGYNEKIENCINLDIDEQSLPFYDKELDFIYSRHVLEDIQNPNFAFKEMLRCSNSGYFETPSPLIEITKGIDLKNGSEKYGGYIHHRYIIWSDIKNCEVFFLPKYSNIIDNFVNVYRHEDIYNFINNEPLHWNNYFIWKDKNPKITVYKNGINFDLTTDNYIKLLNEAINISSKNTEIFKQLIFKKLDFKSI